MTATTRRALLGAILGSAAAGLLPGCRRTELGPPPEELPSFSPGEALPWRNWAGNQGCRPAHRDAPLDERALADHLEHGTGTIRPVGAGHSFSALVPSDDTLVACDRMNGVVRVDSERLEAEVWAGTRLHSLGPALETRGQAMPNLPDIDYQTLGGAVATSTHGTGGALGSLSSYVKALALVTTSGEIIECSAAQNREIFHSARCSLGSLGVVSRMTLANRTPFDVTESVSFQRLEEALDDVESRRERHRHFELYVFPHLDAAMNIAIDEGREDSAPTAGAEFSIQEMRDVYRMVGGIPLIGGALYERLILSAADLSTQVRSGPSYQILANPRIERFREMEYTIPADAGPTCIREILDTIRSEAIPVVYPIEYRYVRGDDVWLSMFNQRDGCSISIHQFADEDHRAYFDVIERIFWKYEGRPHWGKLHSLTAPALEALYPRWKEFVEVRESLDPTGRFLNEHLAAIFGAKQRTAQGRSL
jgi:FAD-linked oxidoreductase